MSGGLPLIALLFVVTARAQAPAPAQPATTVLPVEQFTRYDEFGSLKLSPDGQFVALTTGKYGTSALAFIDLKQSKLVTGLTLPEGYAISEFHWVSATRIIYMLAERVPGRLQPAFTGEIYALDRDGKRHRRIYGYSAGQSSTGTRMRVSEATYATPELISSLRGDDKNILIAEYMWGRVADHLYVDIDTRPRFSLLDVYTGRKDELGTSPLRSARFLVDSHDQVRFAVGYNEKSSYSVSWRRKPDGPWSNFDLAGFGEETVFPQRFSSDDRSVYFSAVRDGETFSALYRLDLETRAVSKAGAFPTSDVVGIITDFADREVIGMHGYTDKLVYEWLVPADPTAKLHDSLARAFPKQSLDFVSATDDGRLAIAFVSSDVNPGEYYLFDTQKKTADFLRATRTWIDPRLMQSKESIQVTARDGTVLHGYLTRGRGDGAHPMVVLPHGGPHGWRDTWGFKAEVQLLANRGYSVLQINYRGSDGYGVKFSDAGYREWGARMQDDVTDATRWAIDQKLAAADRICIMGSSYGGYAALMGAVREPKLYRCAIGMSGIYDLELTLSSGDIPDSKAGRAYLEKALGNDVAQLRSRSPVYNAQLIEAPVLLIHGRSDGRADFEHATRMKDALEKNHKSLEWLALSGEGHGIYDETSRHEVYERILAFLDKHLMQATATAAR